MTHKICTRPFENISLYDDGEISCCCPLYTNRRSESNALFTKNKIYDVGNAIENFWNGSEMQDLRKSVIDGDYNKYCSKCFQKDIYLKDFDKLPNNIKKIVEEKQTVIEAPIEFGMSFDRSCNLSCRSCRKGMITKIDGDIRKKYEDTYDFLLSTKNKKTELFFNGGGDCFGFECFNFLKRVEDNIELFPNLSFSIVTNAQLFNETNANRIKTILSRTVGIVVSVDSPIQETYEKIRINGKWETLIKNLELIKTLCLNNKSYFVLSMVVQKQNYKEMGLFKTFAKTMNANVNFVELRDWFGGDDSWVKDNAVHLPQHPLYDDYINEKKINDIGILT